MASFLESPRFPDDLAAWAKGGVNYSTVVVTSTSGRETRDQLWTFGRGRWDLQNCARMPGTYPSYNVATIRNFFRVCKGRTYGFRFRDVHDYQDEGNGVLGTSGVGNGTPTYQMYKNYVLAPLTDQRLIAKPQVGTVAVLRNGSPVTAGGAPGNYSLDTTTGLVTFVADSQAAVTGWTPGSTTNFTVASVPSGWTVGKVLYFSGMSADTSGLVNNASWAITNIAGTTITIGANTTGKTLTGGTAYLYPQAADALTWTGNFDTPVRFDTDAFEPQLNEDGLVLFQTLTITEIRTS